MKISDIIVENKHRSKKYYRAVINELTVNRNTETRGWSLRDDSTLAPIGNVDSIVLQDVRPVTGDEAFDSGRNVFAFLRGEEADSIPSDLKPFTIFFKRELENPFIDKDTGESIEYVDYVKFDKSGAVIGYK
jgi:hypothetical protein